MAAEGRSWPLPPCPDPAVALADEQYDTTPLSEDACLVRGTFRTVSLDAAMADTPRRLTAVCIRRPEGLRITHLHLSEDGPAASCREEAAGGERIRGNNAALRELIRQTSRALRERNRELEALDRKNIPGGVQCCRNDEEFTILNMNSGLPGLFGYTRADIEERFGGKFARMSHPADLPGVQTMIAEQLSRGRRSIWNTGWCAGTVLSAGCWTRGSSARRRTGPPCSTASSWTLPSRKGNGRRFA